MPASYVHQCIAAEAARRLGGFDGPRSDFALRAGAEGPDPLFYSITPGNPYPPEVGSAMHGSHTADFLLSLAKLAKNPENHVVRNYVCGFFSHYATDTTFHPYVYAHTLTPEGKPSGTLHCTLEHQWETMLFRSQGHTSGLPMQMGGFYALDKSALDMIADALTAAIAQNYPSLALSRRRVRQSFTDSVLLCRLLSSPGGTRYNVLGRVLAPFGMDAALHAHMMPLSLPETDYTNASHASWSSLWEPEKQRNESFFDLYEMAIIRSMELMQNAQAFMDGQISEAELRACHGDLHYDSGLPWQETCTPEEAAAKLSGKQMA